ncbi:hypothetical protein PMAYCL1PPCAC_31793, partial [Pristionchus mayeri]
LLWKIVDFVPDSVFDLRLTSRRLKYRVEEYALQKDYIIEKIIVFDKTFKIDGYEIANSWLPFEERLQVIFLCSIKRT